jgi:hypothetical protein
LRVALREVPPQLVALGETWEERVAEQSSIRRQRTVTLLPSVIVAPEPPPAPPISARRQIGPDEACERLARMAPTEYNPRANVTTRTTTMAAVKPATVILLLFVSVAVFAAGLTALLLTSPGL